MKEKSLDEYFLEGSMQKLDNQAINKLEKEIDDLDNYRRIANPYSIWTEYEFDVLLLVDRILNYITFKHKKAA